MSVQVFDDKLCNLFNASLSTLTGFWWTVTIFLKGVEIHQNRSITQTNTHFQKQTWIDFCNWISFFGDEFCFQWKTVVELCFAQTDDNKDFHVFEMYSMILQLKLPWEHQFIFQWGALEFHYFDTFIDHAWPEKPLLWQLYNYKSAHFINQTLWSANKKWFRELSHDT